ncbi:PIG-L deacetylase family protein [Arthrobacter sp.]|uniref:PIG-L deacetylase family protein n=1 Tax=Arthrobacter sp. TaxID=1667 RepID=UPI0026E08725|nr:PIG-L deacetylase family protein [Arthrobacter sp.]MDO5752141.1 PIG-L deacetylase family protein [Arthrobacter sp.]
MERMHGDGFLSGQRVLVVSPHADDETYGCAGTIARIKSLGGEAFVLLGSLGGVDHYGSASRGETMHRVSANTRLDEFNTAMGLLKVDDWDVMFPQESMHLALDTVPRKDLVRIIERDSRLSVQNIQPTMLLIPSISYNQDHEALFRACMTASRPGLRTERHFIPHVLAYDNTSLFWSPEHERFHPNFYIDVSEFLDVKLNALRAHASQIRGPLFHGSPEGLDLQTQLRGREISVHAAEGFVTHRTVF